MAYVSFEYYTENYIPGSDSIPEDDFARFEKRAREELDRLTFNRIKEDSTLVSEEVQDCTCAIAEALYRADKVPVSANGPLSSYSNDGESGTFELSESMQTSAGKAKKLKEIADRYLFNTGLLYAGRERDHK